MDDFEQGRFRVPASLLTNLGRVGTVVSGALMLAASLGCAELDPSDESYCDLNAGVGTCASQPGDVDGPWWCVNQPPQELPPPQARLVAFVLPAIDWGTRAPMAGNGLTASLCTVLNYACPVPLADPYAVQAGRLENIPIPPPAAGVPVPEGFDGFIKFDVNVPPGTPEAQRYVPETYYLGGAISGETTLGAPILMIQRGQRETIVRQSFSNVDPAIPIGLGSLAFGVYDCNGDPVLGARVEIRMEGEAPAGVLPFQLPASRIPVQQPANQDLTTDPASGLAGYLSVPGGTVQLTAYRTDIPSGDMIGRIEIGSVPGELSVGSIRPPYARDANLRQAPPVAERPGMN